jgi:hypothetical protein
MQFQRVQVPPLHGSSRPAGYPSGGNLSHVGRRFSGVFGLFDGALKGR